jgi:site-specific DNA-methyltransferase (adenine-specific)
MPITYVFHGDCSRWLGEISDGVVDAIITDPPYGIDYQSSWAAPERRKPKIAGDMSPYVDWLGEAFRVVKESGCLVCFCRWDVDHVFKAAIAEAGFTLKSQLVWDKGTHGMGDLRAAFGPQHENAFFAVKGRGFTFPGRRPVSVLRVKKVPAPTHPNEKPVDLLRQLVEALTRPGDVVLDPFCGSGSTAVACFDSGRDCVVGDVSRVWVDKVLSRVPTAHLVQVD